MSFQLIYGDRDIALPLPFDGQTEELLISLLEQPEAEVRSRLAVRFVDALSAMLEGNAIPPTERQIKYAVAIARTLSLELPADVLQYRDAMAAFLSRHAETYRRRKPSAAGQS